MGGRRQSMELRHQRRAHAMKSIQAGLRHWRHVVLYAWAVITAEKHQELQHKRALELLAAQEKAELEEALVAESRKGDMLLKEMENKHRAAEVAQAAEMEACHAAMVRQHTDATRALIADTEAR